MKSLAQLRSDALSIFHDGLKAADPVNAVKRHLNLQGDRLEIQEQTYDLSAYEGIYLVGAGKAGGKWPEQSRNSSVNPVPRTYLPVRRQTGVRGFGALPLQGGRNIHPVPTVLDRGRIILSRRSWNGVHPRAYPDPTNKKNLNAFLGRVLKPQRLIPVVKAGSGLTHGAFCGTG